ncbi:hypothetical protein CSPAE12_00567 [Colletotrichum incanum]|nr:hypothetical protein CSPAE12_00567 [Colletotrichum incanum]
MDPAYQITLVRLKAVL